MLNEFAQIFTQMSTMVIILLIAGFSLMILEIFISGLGTFVFTGSLAVICGTVFRIIDGVTVFQGIALSLICIVLSFILISISINRTRNNRDKRSEYDESDNTTVYSDPFEENGHLIGFYGVSISECRPYGKAKIDGKRYTVISDDGNVIPKGSDIEVVDVDYDRMFVAIVR